MDRNTESQKVVSIARAKQQPLGQMTNAEMDYLISVSREISRIQRKYTGASYISANLDIARFALVGIISQAHEPGVSGE